MTLSLPRDDFRYASYFDMSAKRFDELEALSRSQRATEEEINLQARINKRRRDRQIIENRAAEKDSPNDTKGMREARKEEKEIISGDNNIANRFNVGAEAAPAKEPLQPPSNPVEEPELALGESNDPIVLSQEHEPVTPPIPSEQTGSSPDTSSEGNHPILKREEGDTPEDIKRKIIEMTSWEEDEY